MQKNGEFSVVSFYSLKLWKYLKIFWNGDLLGDLSVCTKYIFNWYFLTKHKELLNAYLKMSLNLNFPSLRLIQLTYLGSVLWNTDALCKWKAFVQWLGRHHHILCWTTIKPTNVGSSLRPESSLWSKAPFSSEGSVRVETGLNKNAYTYIQVRQMKLLVWILKTGHLK